MRLLRTPALLRLVALLLVGGVGASVAPTAAARDARADDLRSLLDDAAAFETALRAAQAPEAAADPVAAFAAAYAEATGGAVTAEVVQDLLDGQSFGLVTPAAPEAVFAPTPASVTSGAGAGILTTPTVVSSPTATSVVPSVAVAAPSRPEAVQSRPRAP
ncbi:MAG: hypothetical protein AAGJ11_14045 [Bacteroidota bacterium]